MILSLISMLGGGLMRLLPEIIAFFNKKTDNSHELAMLDRQVAFEREKTAARLAELQAIGQNEAAAAAAAYRRQELETSSAETLAALSAQSVALQSQMQKIGVPWADALNFLVRPLVTYILVVMYVMVKVAMYAVAVRSGLSGWESVLRIYDDEDRAVLSGVLAFWFVGRVYDKHR